MDATGYINLWIANDEPLYRQALEIAKGYVGAKNAGFRAGVDLQTMMVAAAETTVPELFESGNFVSDLFTWAMGEVDWDEVGQDWLDNLREIDPATYDEAVALVNS